MKRIIQVIHVALPLLVGACATATERADNPMPPRAAASTAAATDEPDPIAAKARALVSASASWTKVTGAPLAKNELCAAAGPVQPHESTHRKGELFHTYVEPGSVDAYVAGRAVPEGGAISKRTFDPTTGDATAHFVMWKEAGKNPEGGDWLYATADAKGALLRVGVLADCVRCHAKQKGDDYLFHKR